MSFHIAFYFAASAIILAHSKIASVNGQCTTEGCGHDDLSMSIITEIREQNAQVLSPLNKQIQNILDLLTSQHDAILRSLQAVDRRLEEHDVYIKQGQSFHELLNASFQEMKSQHENINMSIQAVDRRLWEQGQSIHEHFNESFQEMKSQQGTVMTNLRAAARGSQEHDTCIKQNENIREFLNESFQQTKSQHETVITSLQELDRHSQEQNIYIKQIPGIRELLNESLQQTKSQHDSVNSSLHAVDQRLQNYQTDIKNQTQQTWKLVNDIRDAVNIVRDCSDIKLRGHTENGVYEVCAGHQPNRVCSNAFCDMTTNTASLVFQKRKDGSVNFNRTWAEYKDGFGNPDGEFWLGNEMLYLLTSKRNYKLRVDLEDWEGEKVYAEYATFSINSSTDKYRLTIGRYSGNAGDGMNYNNGRQFTTIDADNDQSRGKGCAAMNGGAWWYGWCSHAFLNGRYHQRHDTVQTLMGITWYPWKNSHSYSLKATEMKLVPVA